MQTAQRGTAPVSPRDITGRRYRELQREKAAREAMADVDIDQLRAQAREAGWSEGWDAAIAWIIGRMDEAGLDPDILVADDESDDNESA